MVLGQRLIKVDFGLCAWLDEQLALGVAERSITVGTKPSAGEVPGEKHGCWTRARRANLLSSDRIVVLDEFRRVRYLLLRERHSDVRRPLHVDVRPSQAGERVRKKKFATVGALVWRMYLGDKRSSVGGVKRGRQN